MMTRKNDRCVRCAGLIGLLLFCFVISMSVTGRQYEAHADDANKAAEAKKKPKRPVQLRAYIVLDSPRDGRLVIEATPDRGWNFMSITQKPGGPLRTRIELQSSKEYEVDGQWKATPLPSIHRYDDIWEDLDVEQHHERVTWTVPIRLAEEGDSRVFEIRGRVRLQVQSPDIANVYRIPISASVKKPESDKGG